MRRLIFLVLLSAISLSMSAQSVDQLKKLSKTTQKEKDDARITSDGGYRGGSSGIDLDADDTTWGMGYNYSKHFPLALNANYTISYFSIGGELGFNLDKKKIVRSEIETDDPIMYLSIAPGFYCKYFSINCGIGALMAHNQQTWTKSFNYGGAINVTTITINGSSSTIITEGESGVSSVFTGTDDKIKFGLLINPSIKGYIPLNSDSDSYLTLNVGYMIMPKFKALNGFSFGVGFQVEL